MSLIVALKITVQARKVKELAYLESHCRKLITSGEKNGGTKWQKTRELDSSLKCIFSSNNIYTCEKHFRNKSRCFFSLSLAKKQKWFAGVLQNKGSKKHTYTRVFFLTQLQSKVPDCNFIKKKNLIFNKIPAWNVIKKDIQAQAFSC